MALGRRPPAPAPLPLAAAPAALGAGLAAADGVVGSLGAAEATLRSQGAGEPGQTRAHRLPRLATVVRAARRAAPAPHLCASDLEDFLAFFALFAVLFAFSARGRDTSVSA